MNDTAVLLIAHGTVDKLDDLPAFVTNIRRGHPAPQSLIDELRKRYEAIGGRSPLTSITNRLAEKLETRLGIPTRVSMRLWHPYPSEVLTALVEQGIRKVVVIPLAQHSASVYGNAVVEAANALDRNLEVICAKNWGREPALTHAFSNSIRRAMNEASLLKEGDVHVIMTAHSLPLSVIKSGDPYEIEVRASADAVAKEVGLDSYSIAFQSQGLSTGPGGKTIEWLGPDLKSVLHACADSGTKTVLIAPIGFLADHVEILYDIDIEARGWAESRGMRLVRTASLNDSSEMVNVISNVALPLLKD